MTDRITKIETLLDGGNPRKEDSINQINNNSFSVEPFSEDNDPNYKFRFEILATNSSDQPQDINLTIKWNEPTFNKYRRAIYYRNENNDFWKENLMNIGKFSTIGNITLLPGENIIASQPAYSYSELTQYLETVASTPQITLECLGETGQKRKIYQIIINKNSRTKVKNSIVIVCRIHPYETSGSYCAEGIINAVIDKSDTILNKLDNCRIHLIPMANPDGVHGGLCKRTAYDGIDLSSDLDVKDSTCSTIIDFLDDVRPNIYCEIHNWMLPEVDGIYSLNPFQICRLLRRLPKKNHKKWQFNLNKFIFPSRSLGFKKYCNNRFESTSFVLEFPWFRRSTNDMRKIGVHSLNAISQL